MKSKFDVLKRDEFRCGYCGVQALEGAELHLDHIVPRTAGGTNTYGNLITSCGKCNVSKGGRALPAEILGTYLAAVKLRCLAIGVDPDGAVEWFEMRSG